MKMLSKYFALLISFFMVLPFVKVYADDETQDVGITETESGEASEAFKVTGLKICSLKDGYPDEANPLAVDPLLFTFDMGKEYALLLSYEGTPDSDYFRDLIANTGVLYSSRGAAGPGGAMLIVKVTQTGTGNLVLDSDYTVTIYAINSNAGWKSNSTGWWYVREDGTYPANTFEEIDGKTYYFNASGYMVTGWQTVNGEYYFFETSGAMKTNAWEGNYYLLADGRMAKDQWVDNNKYYVGADGKWIPNYGTAHWESNSTGWWYVRADGTYPANTFEEINGKTYYFNASGYMVTGWKSVDGEYYFFEASGAMKTNAWEGNYYLLADGRMARSQWVDGGRYYVGPDGRWVDNDGGSSSVTYVASRNSEVFHRSNCPAAQNIKQSNLIVFSSREEAASGRRPCKDCNP